MFAARVGDMHICPLVTPPGVPHVGGPIIPPGAAIARVLIGKLPAARMGDMCTCVGPPDSILGNCAMNVIIGGQPAARLGSTTVHGGAVILGCFTVLMGSGAGSAAAAAGAAASAASAAAAGAAQIASSAAEAVSELEDKIAQMQEMDMPQDLIDAEMEKLAQAEGMVPD